MAARGALARCVGDVDAFLADRFGRAPHHWRSERFDDLLSLEDVDAQLTGAGLRRPAVRLVRDGEVLDPTSWTRPARTGAVRIDDLVDPARLLAEHAQGATVVLQSLHRWWPPLTRFCHDLEDSLGHAAQVNAYLTPPGSAGLTPHHDTHDVFVLQVHGTKHWMVREPLVEAPLARHRSDHDQAAAQPVRFEADLAPGDCLYLPRGTIHSAATQQGTSLHLTIGVLATTVHDLLRRLVDRAAEEPSLRRSLPPHFAATPQAAAAVLKDAAADLIRWLGTVDVDALAPDLVTAGGARRSAPLGGQLLELAGLDRIDDDTTVVRRERLRLELVPVEDGRSHLRTGDRTIDLPSALSDPVTRLLDGGHHRVQELGDVLDRPSRLVLVRRLVGEGLLRTVDGP